MKHTVILSLAAIPSIGVLVQWLAVRLKLPSILLLLISGFCVGPIFKLIDPDQLFGDILYPFISLSVALILFEGGLSLRIKDLRHTGAVVRNLITIGLLVSWIGISASSYFFLGFDIRLSILLGAILLVSGPTVVTPLLRQIKLKHSLSSILRWEGITIDPLGATLAVLVFEVILAQRTSDAIGLGVMVIGSTLLVGIVLGTLSALLIVVVLKKRWMPEYLQEAFTFIVVLSSYAISDVIQSESGLFVVTMMGIVLANQKLVTIRHIISFKENITVLLLSSLFILLAARIEFSQLSIFFNWNLAFFLAALIFVMRPLSIYFSTIGTFLSVKEKLFLSLIFPRGIVAAAVASLFAIRLQEAGFEEAYQLVPVTFLTIIITVTFYGLLGRPLVRLFSLQRDQKGILIVGANGWAREFAKALALAKVDVLVVDTNFENVVSAKEEGLRTKHGSILSKKLLDEFELSNYGKLLAVTPSDEINLLSSIEYADIFGAFNTFRLYPKDRKKDVFTKTEKGLFLFDKGITYTFLEASILSGASFKPTTISNEFSYDDFKAKYPKAVCVCMINKKGRLKFFFQGHKYRPVSGCTIISLRR